MLKHGIDQDALVSKISEATAKQGEAIRKAVHDTTLVALQGRELTLTNMKQVLDTVAKAVSSGAVKSSLRIAGVEALLGKAVAGMDGALQKVVEANHRVLRQMLDQGATLQETQTKKALADIEKMEDTLLDVMRKFAKDAGADLAGPWGHVLKTVESKGTVTGTQAAATLEHLMDSAQANLLNLRNGRAPSLRTSQAMLASDSILVRGVLIGMSGALQQASGVPESTHSRER